MTRRDFNLIATVLRETEMDWQTRSRLVNEFQRQLRLTNSRFDAGRFADACLPQLREEVAAIRCGK